jgi:hypothetical protein
MSPTNWVAYIFIFLAKGKKPAARHKEVKKQQHADKRHQASFPGLDKTPAAKPITMYDSVDVAQIPPNPEAVAGYVGGNWPTFNTLKQQFPKAKKLSIAVNAREDADCLDVEVGDATPNEVPQWVTRQWARGIRRPCIYANLSTMGDVVLRMQANGINRKHIRLWVAHYTNIAHIPPSGYNYDGCQWTSRAHGRNLDCSLLREDFFD